MARRSELPGGVYGLLVVKHELRTTSRGTHILMVKARVLQPLAQAGRHISLGINANSYGKELIKDLFDAVGMPMDIRSSLALDKLVGEGFVARVSYTTTDSNRPRRYLKVQPLLMAPDGQYKDPYLARSEQQAWGRVNRVSGPRGPQVQLPDGCSMDGAKSGRFQSSQPNFEQLPCKPGNLKEAVAESSGIYCNCASPKSKLVVFDTFSFHKCEGCGKEIQGG